MPGITLQCYIGQQQGNLKPSTEKTRPTVTFDSSLQEQATRESHHKTRTQSTWKRKPGHRGEGPKF